MVNTLTSSKWPDAVKQMKECHLSTIGAKELDTSIWKAAFDALVEAILDERKLNPDFSTELDELTEASGSSYDFADVLEEYFDFLEDHEDYEAVIASADKMVELFRWEKKMPSEYKFRKGNALEHLGRFDEAEKFGEEWLADYPYDLYAAASNVFLKVELQKLDEARELTEKYLRDDLVCDSETDTFFMAAYRLYEMTDDINAKQRVEKKLAEYNAIVSAMN